MTHYVGATTHGLLRSYRLPARMSFRRLLDVGWREPRCKFSPLRAACFAYAAEWDAEGVIELLDEDGCRMLRFCPNGVTNYYA